MIEIMTATALAARHHLGPELAGNLAGINGLTDAVVAS